MRDASRGGTRVDCGVCGNCLPRRMSLFTAGIPDVTAYKVVDLHAGSQPQSGRILAEIEGLARYHKRSHQEVRKNLMELLNQHSHEWAQFLAFCGERSWVAQLARG